MDFYGILREHAARYPEMRINDLLKLAFQSGFGCGHFAERGAALARLKEEYASCGHGGRELFVPLGEGRARLMLDAAVLREEELPLVARFFSAASEEDAALGDGEEAFRQKTEDILRAAREGMFPRVPPQEAALGVREYFARGAGPLSHSAEYRAAYRPAYRVFSRTAVRLFSAAREIGRRLSAGERLVVGIDGRAAAGKTTAARFLSSVFDADVVHCDDFFLPSAMRTEARLAEPGGNLDRERLLGVLRAAEKGGPFSYGIYDCGLERQSGSRALSGAPVLLTEGSYALHPDLFPFYSVTLFLDVSPDEQRRRILARSPDLAPRFFSEWIPMEERYAEAFSLREKVDFLL
ncbi:MAG: hypothetical protein II771_06295 [Clostridia bacterium]|nr:hypothetical protein [Clostridia bacterium]